MSEMKRNKIVRSEIGTVISDKMDKTITVLVERKVQDPLYKKYVKRSTKIKAHDEHNECQQGDRVRIQAQSGIGRNVRDDEVLQGSPALNYGDYNKSYVHFKNLPKIVNRISEVEKKIDSENRK